MLKANERPREFFGDAPRSLPLAERRIGVSGREIQSLGELVLRYGLVLVLLWIGGMKFTAFEADAIRPLVGSSPFLSWMYSILSDQAVSNLFGIVEISVAAAIALRPWAPRVSAVGSALAAVMFLTTLSFLFFLPGWEASLGGFPALSGAGGFLVKDAVLLGTALWSLGDSLAAAETENGELRNSSK